MEKVKGNKLLFHVVLFWKVLFVEHTDTKHVENESLCLNSWWVLDFTVGFSGQFSSCHT